MANQRKLIGRLPVFKGEWSSLETYNKLNEVTLYGSSFRSKIDGNTSKPAELNAQGTGMTVNENWYVVANGTDAYLAGEKIASIDGNTSTYNVSRFHQHTGFWEAVEYDESEPAYLEVQEYTAGNRVNLVNYTNHTFVAMKSMTGVMPDYNNISNKFTLEEAILFVPSKYRLTGMNVGFLDSSNKPVVHKHKGGTFTKVSNWEEDVQTQLTELSSLKNQFAVNAGLLPVTVDFKEKTLSWEEGGFIIYGNGKNSSMAVLAGEQQFESTNESSGIQYITYNTQDSKYHFYRYSDDFDRGKNAFVAVIAGSSKKVLYSIVTIKDENDNILFEDSESLKEKIKPLKVDVDSLKEEGYIFKNFNPENSIQKTINQSIKKLAISNYVEGLKILVTRNNATVTDVSIGTGTSSTDIVEMFHFIFAKTSIQAGLKSMKIENEYGKASIVVDFDLLNNVSYTNLYADDYILSEWNCSTNKWGESTKSRIIVVDEKGSGDYTSLQDAIDNAGDSKNNPRTIMVLPGTYVMPAYDSTTRSKCYNRYLSIVGTDKNQCIVRNDVGYYNTNPWQDNAPIKMQGNVYLERLTVICTDDNFVLPEGVEESYEGRYNKAYCVHFDHECEAETIAEINNCRLINNHFACVGIGTRNTIKIVDTELEMTLYETFPSNLYGNDVGVIAGHDGNTDSRQTLFIKNCVIKNENGNYSVTMSNAYGKNVDISLLFNYANKPLKLTGDNMVKTEMCYGNNQETFNV